VKTRKNVNRSQIEFPDACSMKPNFLVTYLLGFSTFVFNNTKGYIYMHEISLGYTQTSRRLPGTMLQQLKRGYKIGDRIWQLTT